MINVYTDGSIFPNPGGPGGWAFFAVDQYGEITEKSGGLIASPINTNNRLEMMGLLNALIWLDGRSAAIYSDSQYVVNGMNEWINNWARRGWYRMQHGVRVEIPNRDLWQLMLPLRSKDHRIQWVRGHDGTAGNERADKLAEAARISVTAGTTIEEISSGFGQLGLI